MILDDRPVIDQLTEPSPANVVYEALATQRDRVLDAEPEFMGKVAPELKLYLNSVGTDHEEYDREDFLSSTAGYALDYVLTALDNITEEVLARLA